MKSTLIRGPSFLTALLCCGLLAAADDKPAPDKAAVFEMREISVLKPNAIAANYRLARGAYAACTEEPATDVKAYPPLKSKHPLYGALKCLRDPATGKTTEIHFVLDESGEENPVGKPGADGTAEHKEAAAADHGKAEQSLFDSIVDALASKAKEPKKPVKKSPLEEAKWSSYDRLYIDMNRDGDLTNDPVVKPRADVPWNALPSWQVVEKMGFAYIDFPVDFGPGVGIRPLQVLPWLSVSARKSDAGDELHRTMHFVVTTARQGRIRIGPHAFNAVLAQPYAINGPFNALGAALFLKPVDPKQKIDYAGFASDSLQTVHQIGETLYTTSATPLGDKLTVKPYCGDFGVFKLGAGGRNIEKLAFRGSLASQDMSIGLRPAASVAADDKRELPEYASEFRVPVGDYAPQYLSIVYGNLRINISENYHSDGRPLSLEHIYNRFIQIRKDKPFVFAFCHKPEVLFASPGKDKTFKPGEEVSVKAVLIDPQWDIMIRDLCDTSQKKKITYKVGNGGEHSYERDLSLDPTVTITNAAGKKIAEGPMPFG